MNLKALSEILTKHGGCNRDGQAFLVPSGSSLTIYTSLGIEPLIIERVSRIEIDQEILVVGTSRKERYIVAPEDVRAIRFAGTDGGPGYGSNRD